MSQTQTVTRKSKAARIALFSLAALMFIMGAGIIYFTTFHEQEATKLYGDVKLYTADVIRENGGTPPGQETSESGLPVIRLEGAGGQVELDMCTGAFVNMTSYQDKNNLPPVWSAHNGCGGDIILGFEIGTRFVVGDREYEVVDFRQAPQVGGTTDNIAGITGDLVLQSCTYDGVTMFFFGANLVKTAEELAAEKAAEEEKLSSGEVEAQEEVAQPEEPSLEGA